MSSAYIYSVSRTNTLAQFLLSKTDIERLLVAEPGDDIHDALKETYLASYVMKDKEEDMSHAIEQTLVDAKRLVHKIAPNGDMFRVLWVQYDIHNLRVFAKAKVQELDFIACQPFTSKRGIYEPETLFIKAQANELNQLQEGWQEVFDAAVALVEAGALDKVDTLFDEEYFATSKRIAVKSKDAFIQRYVAALIDTYNLKATLRTLRYPQITNRPLFISGGTVALDQLQTVEDVQYRFSQLSREEFWRPAVQYYMETGNSTRIDARVDEYLLLLAKDASIDMFSSASLVLYYLLCRQAAANIRTIVVGKNSGMKEEDIRANLRMAYVNQ